MQDSVTKNVQKKSSLVNYTNFIFDIKLENDFFILYNMTHIPCLS